MSATGNALLALKNVVLMEERLSQNRDDVAGLSCDLVKLKGVVHDIDKRLYAVERLIDFGAQQSRQRRIED